MASLTSSTVYIFLFVSLYFEVFLLITYFESKVSMREETARTKRVILKYPTVTIIVPCWNEENTISKTVHSLLNLNYPQDKLKIMIVDDGSTDSTWEVIKKFENKKQIEVYQKENGGKHTALNFALTKVTSDLVGCLDADSYVDKDALKNIVVYFEDKETMCVLPSVQIWKPKTILQLIQKVEYALNILVRKMFSYMGAIYVTPGPFSIFRLAVFQELGGYKYAHQTEDMEMAVRMQSNHYKIVTAHDAFVYTIAPETIKKLYKQRLRWTYGFIKNSIDYKHLFFNKEYGNLGLFILPMATLSVISTLFVLGVLVTTIIEQVVSQYIRISAIGLSWPTFSFDWFYFNTEVITIASLIAFFGTLTMIFISQKMTDKKNTFGLDIVYYLALYTFIAPLWVTKAVYNAVFSVTTKWR